MRRAGAGALARIHGEPEAVVWHDVECAGYAADLPTWRALAEEAGGPGVLDLGCGTGRVAIDLAARGHDVTALDADPELVEQHGVAIERGHREPVRRQVQRDAAGAGADVEHRPAARELLPQREVGAVAPALGVVPRHRERCRVGRAHRQ